MKKRLLKECLRLAIAKNTPELHPQFGNYHHFCFVIQNNKIIEYGTNMPGTPPKFAGYAGVCKIHAEFMAFKRAKGLLNKDYNFEAVNIRLNKQNELRMSSPCKCCYSFLTAEGCNKIWFTTNYGWAQI